MTPTPTHGGYPDVRPNPPDTGEKMPRGCAEDEMVEMHIRNAKEDPELYFGWAKSIARLCRRVSHERPRRTQAEQERDALRARLVAIEKGMCGINGNKCTSFANDCYKCAVFEFGPDETEIAAWSAAPPAPGCGAGERA